MNEELRSIAKLRLAKKEREWAGYSERWHAAPEFVGMKCYYDAWEKTRIRKGNDLRKALRVYHAAKAEHKSGLQTLIPLIKAAQDVHRKVVWSFGYQSNSELRKTTEGAETRFSRPCFALLVEAYSLVYRANDFPPSNFEPLPYQVADAIGSQKYDMLTERLYARFDSEEGYVHCYTTLSNVLRGKRTPIRLGRLLRAVWTEDRLSNEYIKAAVAALAPPHHEYVTLRNHDPYWADKPLELQQAWCDVYSQTKVDFSCMRGSTGPCAYGLAAPWNKFGVIQFLSPDGEEYAGRAIVTWNEDDTPKEYVRVYPAEENYGWKYSEYSLQRFLGSLGFKRNPEALAGFALAVRRLDGDSLGFGPGHFGNAIIAIPYLDGGVVINTTLRTIGDQTYMMVEKQEGDLTDVQESAKKQHGYMCLYTRNLGPIGGVKPEVTVVTEEVPVPPGIDYNVEYMEILDELEASPIVEHAVHPGHIPHPLNQTWPFANTTLTPSIKSNGPLVLLTFRLVAEPLATNPTALLTPEEYVVTRHASVNHLD